MKNSTSVVAPRRSGNLGADSSSTTSAFFHRTSGAGGGGHQYPEASTPGRGEKQPSTRAGSQGSTRTTGRPGTASANTVPPPPPPSRVMKTTTSTSANTNPTTASTATTMTRNSTGIVVAGGAKPAKGSCVTIGAGARYLTTTSAPSSSSPNSQHKLLASSQKKNPQLQPQPQLKPLEASDPNCFGQQQHKGGGFPTSAPPVISGSSKSKPISSADTQPHTTTTTTTRGTQQQQPSTSTASHGEAVYSSTQPWTMDLAHPPNVGCPVGTTKTTKIVDDEADAVPLPFSANGSGGGFVSSPVPPPLCLPASAGLNCDDGGAASRLPLSGRGHGSTQQHQQQEDAYEYEYDYPPGSVSHCSPEEMVFSAPLPPTASSLSTLLHRGIVLLADAFDLQDQGLGHLGTGEQQAEMANPLVATLPQLATVLRQSRSPCRENPHAKLHGQQQQQNGSSDELLGRVLGAFATSEDQTFVQARWVFPTAQRLLQQQDSGSASPTFPPPSPASAPAGRIDPYLEDLITLGTQTAEQSLTGDQHRRFLRLLVGDDLAGELPDTSSSSYIDDSSPPPQAMSSLLHGCPHPTDSSSSSPYSPFWTDASSPPTQRSSAQMLTVRHSQHHLLASTLSSPMDTDGSSPQQQPLADDDPGRTVGPKFHRIHGLPPPPAGAGSNNNRPSHPMEGQRRSGSGTSTTSSQYGNNGAGSSPTLTSTNMSFAPSLTMGSLPPSSASPPFATITTTAASLPHFQPPVDLCAEMTRQLLAITPTIKRHLKRDTTIATVLIHRCTRNLCLVYQRLNGTVDAEQHRCRRNNSTTSTATSMGGAPRVAVPTAAAFPTAGSALAVVGIKIPQTHPYFSLLHNPSICVVLAVITYTFKEYCQNAFYNQALNTLMITEGEPAGRRAMQSGDPKYEDVTMWKVIKVMYNKHRHKDLRMLTAAKLAQIEAEVLICLSGAGGACSPTAAEVLANCKDVETNEPLLVNTAPVGDQQSQGAGAPSASSLPSSSSMSSLASSAGGGRSLITALLDEVVRDPKLQVLSAHPESATFLAAAVLVAASL